MLILLLNDWWTEASYEKSLRDHYITIIFQQLGNLEELT